MNVFQFLYRVDAADPAETELRALGCRDQGRPQQAKWGFPSTYNTLFPKWPVSKKYPQNLEHLPLNLWPGAWVVQQS